jgi:predicted RNA-binding Zn ribbon-like protein
MAPHPNGRRSPAPSGQWLREPDGRRWWFDSGSRALDFAYTGSFAYEHGDQLAYPADLTAWLRERFDSVDGEVGERELRDAVLFRDALARAVLAVSKGRAAEPADVDTVNLFAATPDIPPVLAGGSRQAGRTTARYSQALSALAREAVGLLDAANADRIRACDADDCAIVFADDSRSNNRRWCSMARCGNRTKVRKHRLNALA